MGAHANETSMTRPTALTIAGSDSGGGAGIQADLRAFSALGCYGTTAITAVTAQNLSGVDAVLGIEARLVEAQVRAVLSGFEVRATKTGMLWTADTVEAVAAFAGELGSLVVDPVMVATSGDPLLQEDAVRAYRDTLLPRASLATPNLDEAATLLGVDAVPREEIESAARDLERQLGCPVLLKGGHLDGDPVDLLSQDGVIHRWQHPRVTMVNTHGSGCTLSAAITARLARGDRLVAACTAALDFLHRAFALPHLLSDGTRLAGIETA
jgi:hydroxymethylpyrimidine/phosphomethylpyrimidine kinase